MLVNAPPNPLPHAPAAQREGALSVRVNLSKLCANEKDLRAIVNPSSLPGVLDRPECLIDVSYRLSVIVGVSS
jgi:hypothetical protein